MLEQVEGLDRQMALGYPPCAHRIRRSGALLMKLRIDEPEDFAACAGAAGRGWFPTSPTSGPDI